MTLSIDIETICSELLSKFDEKVTQETTALETIANFIFENIDDFEEFEAIAEDEELSPWELAIGHVQDMIESELFSKESLRLYRSIQVTCSPSEVVTSGTASEIGVCWSTEEELEDQTFLDQYGEEGGRVVSFVAEVNHADVDWIPTFWKRLDPGSADYSEVVLRADAVPKIISVSDPEATPTPAPR